MANVRVTKRDMFNEILANYELSEAHKEFIEKQIVLLEKKSGANRKPTKTQEANEGIKQDIVDGMAEGERYTITDLIKTIEAIADYSNQKISNLANQLVKANVLAKVTEKGRTYFYLAD